MGNYSRSLLLHTWGLQLKMLRLTVVLVFVAGAAVASTDGEAGESPNEPGSPDEGEEPAQNGDEEQEAPWPSWGDWGEWSKCSETCDIGTKRRTRECFNIINMEQLDVAECKVGVKFEDSLEYRMEECTEEVKCPD